MPLNKRPDGSFPAPIPTDEAERLRALNAYAVLDTLPERVFDDLAFIASHICGTPIALISLIDKDRQWFKARTGLDAGQTPRDYAFCAHAILEPHQLFQVPDASRDERFNTNPLVTSDPSIRFYAGVPLVTPDGYSIGTLCAIDRKPRELDPEQQRAMFALSREVMSQLELRRTIAALEKALAAAAASTLRGADDATQRARDLIARAGAPADGMEDRMRELLTRMQQLQKRNGDRGA